MSKEHYIHHELLEGDTLYDVISGVKLSQTEVNRAIRDVSLHKPFRRIKRGGKAYKLVVINLPSSSGTAEQ